MTISWLYHHSLYQFDQPQPSFREASLKGRSAIGQTLAGDVSCDVAVIGAGCTGVYAAIHPAIGRFPDDPSVMFGFGYHGNGVNSATWVGRELARGLQSSNNSLRTMPEYLPALVRGMPRRFPLPRLRRLYVRAGILYYRLKDLYG